MAIDLGLDVRKLVVRFLAETKIFLFSTSFRPTLGHTQTPLPTGKSKVKLFALPAVEVYKSPFAVQLNIKKIIYSTNPLTHSAEFLNGRLSLISI
jgi:hypothetical protein